MTAVQASWTKHISTLFTIICATGSLIVTITMVGTKMMDKQDIFASDMLSVKGDIRDVKAKVDTIRSHQVDNEYNNRLNFQAIWNELNKRNGHSQPSAFQTERVINGRIVLTPVR